jgi:UDP-N-acetylglucosamine:LPS N-acetylglucosamine transferase
MTARNEYISGIVRETHAHRFPNRSFSIFCVSNKTYKKTRKRVGEHEIQMKGTGIPRLRSYCHKIPARAQFRIANHFLDVRLKDLVQQVQLWLAGGSQEIMPNDRTVQKLLDTLQNELQEVRQGRTLQN